MDKDSAPVSYLVGFHLSARVARRKHSCVPRGGGPNKITGGMCVCLGKGSQMPGLLRICVWAVYPDRSSGGRTCMTTGTWEAA